MIRIIDPRDLPFLQEVGRCAQCGADLLNPHPDTLLCASCATSLLAHIVTEKDTQMLKAMGIAWGKPSNWAEEPVGLYSLRGDEE
jgi:predicted amidophosphoribosyltransferase